MADNNIVLLINGSLQDQTIDEDSKLLIEAVDKLKCEYIAIDVKGKPAFLEAFP